MSACCSCGTSARGPRRELDAGLRGCRARHYLLQQYRWQERDREAVLKNPAFLAAWRGWRRSSASGDPRRCPTQSIGVARLLTRSLPGFATLAV